jgi:acetyl-CoA C-acetyltransferase
MTEILIVSGARTAIGDFGGSLKDVPPTELGAIVIREALERGSVPASDVEHVVMGNVIHSEARDMYLSRVSAINAGIPVTAPAMTLNRLCGSGLQAVVSAAQMILLGDISLAVAGGAESMSRGGYLVPSARWGARLSDATMVDMVAGALNDPFGNGHMGITAENVAAAYDIGRAQQDEFAVESHRRAAVAIAEGRFNGQIVPVNVKVRKQTVPFAIDEHVRKDIEVEALSALRPAFKQDGTITAGNASSLNDGAAAIVLMEADEAAKRGIRGLARIVGYAHAGVEPSVMGLGPIPAVERLLAKTGLTVSDLDVIESNEAFAAQACAVSSGLGLPADKVNPNGGAIALGHPIGATGAIILIKLIYELQRIGGRYGLATMCIGGGQGIALLVENCF